MVGKESLPKELEKGGAMGGNHGLRLLALLGFKIFHFFPLGKFALSCLDQQGAISTWARFGRKQHNVFVRYCTIAFFVCRDGFGVCFDRIGQLLACACACACGRVCVCVWAENEKESQCLFDWV